MKLQLTNPAFDIQALEVAIESQALRYRRLVHSLEAMIMRGEMHDVKLLERAHHLQAMCETLKRELHKLTRRHSKRMDPDFTEELELHFTDQIQVLHEGLNDYLVRYEQLMGFVAAKDDAVLSGYSYQGYKRAHELRSQVMELYLHRFPKPQTSSYVES